MGLKGEFKAFSRYKQKGWFKSRFIDFWQRLDEWEKEQEWIMGSVECSVHEFYGTALGRERMKNKILYVTEVAVNPKARSVGVGKKLLKGVEELASMRNVETLYL